MADYMEMKEVEKCGFPLHYFPWKKKKRNKCSLRKTTKEWQNNDLLMFDWLFHPCIVNDSPMSQPQPVPCDWEWLGNWYLI